MKTEITDILKFLSRIEKLKNVLRHSKTSSGRRESSAEHSWRMAVFALLLQKHFPEVDMLKTIKMCLYHDLGEIVEGDIPAFYKDEADELNEFNNLKLLLGDISLNIKKEILEAIDEFNRKETPEAKLATAIDKLEGVIQHNEADLSSWIRKEYHFNLEYGTEETQYNDFLRELRKAVKEVSVKKIEAAGKFPAVN